MRISLILLLLGLGFNNQVLADQIRTIELQNRFASEVLPLIEPMTDRDLQISGRDNLLIIKSALQRFEEIENLVNQLDTPMQSITISVLRAQQQLQNHQLTQGKLDIDLQDPSDSRVEIQSWSTRNNRERNQQYRARGIAGQPIEIHMGHAVATQHQQFIFQPYGGVAMQETTEYIPLDNGFQAKVNLQKNDQARVESLPLFSKLLRNGDIETTSVITTVQGPLDQWLPLGRIGEREQNQSNNSYRSHQDEQQWLYLKIELN